MNSEKCPVSPRENVVSLPSVPHSLVGPCKIGHDFCRQLVPSREQSLGESGIESLIVGKAVFQYICSRTNTRSIEVAWIIAGKVTNVLAGSDAPYLFRPLPHVYPIRIEDLNGISSADFNIDSFERLANISASANSHNTKVVKTLV